MQYHTLMYGGGMAFLIFPIGLSCMAAAIVHGYLGQTRLIEPGVYGHRWAKGFIQMIWHYSTVTWALIGAFIAASPWVLNQNQRKWMVPLVCLPIVYGVIGNMLVSRGRHFGWKIFAGLIAAAAITAQF